MAAKRSRTGCLTCRQRKLKCSEEKPTCAQCVKANRECVVASGITFRHHQNPSMNGDEKGKKSLERFYGYKETFGRGVHFVPIPSELTFVHTNNPYDDEDDGLYESRPRPIARSSREPSFAVSQAEYPAYATHGLEALSAVASDQYSYAPPPALFDQPEPPPPPPGNQASPTQNLEFILNPPTALSTAESNIDPQLNTPNALLIADQSPDHVRTHPFPRTGQPHSRSQGLHRHPAISTPDLAFLLRDYSSRAGAWMDLYDLAHFFGAQVPVLAVKCPLLLYACAALSAKSLARVDGRGGGRGCMESGRSKMEDWPGPTLDAEEWMRKAIEFYDIAVSLLRQALAGAERPATASVPDDAVKRVLSTTQEYILPATDSDEVVAATAILCVYESLDASGAAWGQHLDGTKTLFDVAKDKMLSGTPHTLPPPRRAIFWNFARQDMLSAFINNTSTRLDTSDLPMWRSAGLVLSPGGFVPCSDPLAVEYIAEHALADDMLADALVWLLMKLVNFIAAGDEVDANLSPLGFGIRQGELLDYWTSLDEQLRVWHESLPAAFHPTIVRDIDREVEEAWFPRAMCASAMQHYHFARIQLLLNKPHLSTATPGTLGPGTALASRHASYAAILRECRAHAKEIVAIGRGRSDEGTRIHSVQPLWTAGLVLGDQQQAGDEREASLETESWRRKTLGLLREIERNTGWASEYRVRSLLELWGLPADWPGDLIAEDE